MAGSTDARVAILGPNPLLTITIEAADRGTDDVHLHAGGQGVWVTRMAAELGARPTLCGLVGGETGSILRPLLEALPGEARTVPSAGGSGFYVMDRRSGEREVVASGSAPLPSRHEVDDLFSVACAAALESDVLVICNPWPGEALPLELFGNLVSDVRANGTPVLVDLSSPRLESALDAKPDLVKLNDWELAQFVAGPVGTMAELTGAIARLHEGGARCVIVTRGGESAFASREGELLELVPPHFERGSREGCGDSMMGAIAAAWAQDLEWREVLVLGAAAGAANFLRHGLGTGARPVIDELTSQVVVQDAVG